MDWVGFFAIWFWLNANAVFNFYSPLSVFYKRFFCPTCLSILFTRIRTKMFARTKPSFQTNVSAIIVLHSEGCNVGQVKPTLHCSDNKPFPNQGGQQQLAQQHPHSRGHQESTHQGVMLPIPGLLQTPYFKISWRKQSNSLISAPSSQRLPTYGFCLLVWSLS